MQSHSAGRQLCEGDRNCSATGIKQRTPRTAGNHRKPARAKEGIYCPARCQTLSFQNRETRDFCCFKPSSVWSFVTAAPQTITAQKRESWIKVLHCRQSHPQRKPGRRTDSYRHQPIRTLGSWQVTTTAAFPAPFNSYWKPQLAILSVMSSGSTTYNTKNLIFSLCNRSIWLHWIQEIHNRRNLQITASLRVQSA